jgi:hypothetical protein
LSHSLQDQRGLRIVARSNLNLVPIEAMVQVEARIFRSDDSVLNIGRDWTERNA